MAIRAVPYHICHLFSVLWVWETELETGPWWAVVPWCLSTTDSPALAPSSSLGQCLAREMVSGIALYSCSRSGDPLAFVPGASGRSLSYLAQNSGKHLPLSLDVTVYWCEVCCGFSLLAPRLSNKATQGGRQSPESRAASPEACPFSGHPVFEPIHFLYVKASLSWKPKHPNDSLNPHFIFSNPLVSPRECGSNCKARQSNTIKLNWRSVGVDWHPLHSQQESSIVSSCSKYEAKDSASRVLLFFIFSQKLLPLTQLPRMLERVLGHRHEPYSWKNIPAGSTDLSCFSRTQYTHVFNICFCSSKIIWVLQI